MSGDDCLHKYYLDGQVIDMDKKQDKKPSKQKQKLDKKDEKKHKQEKRKEQDDLLSELFSLKLPMD